VGWLHNLKLAQQWSEVACFVVVLPWLHHIQYLADVTVVTKSCNLL
jgi:hypothetical protein